MGEDDVRAEWLKCDSSPAYFIHNYVQIYDATDAAWVPFHLWPAQYSTLRDLVDFLLVIILKARQLGLTWLVLAYALWKMLFRPAQTVMLFSRRETEAIYLLRKRLRGMYFRLPEWLQAESVVTDSQHEFSLSNGSVAYAFPTTAGDSYTASLVIVDEADLVPDLATLMNSVKPTIDGGGAMILLSRANKDEPNSPFKKYYRAAKKGENTWKDIFLPWTARPSRTPEWYEEQRSDIASRTGSLDDLWQQYPITDTEALAPRTLAKRIPPMWLEKQYVEVQSEDTKGTEAPTIPGLKVYEFPLSGSEYVIGADPAEGNPTSDDSSCVVLDEISGEEVATFSGKFEPNVFAEHVSALAAYYNRARLLVERNNHGHTVIAWLREHSDIELIRGTDGRYGWATSGQSKAFMYSTAAECLRDGLTWIHTFETYMQLSSIDGSTLKAPRGEFDDRAVAFVLALQGIHMPKYEAFSHEY